MRFGKRVGTHFREPMRFGKRKNFRELMRFGKRTSTMDIISEHEHQPVANMFPNDNFQQEISSDNIWKFSAPSQPPLRMVVPIIAERQARQVAAVTSE